MCWLSPKVDVCCQYCTCNMNSNKCLYGYSKQPHSSWLWCNFTLPYSCLLWLFHHEEKGISHCKYLELRTQWHSTSFQRPQSSTICYENFTPQINFLLLPPQHFYALLGHVPLSTRKKILKYLLQLSIMSAGICFYIEFFFDKHLHSKCEISIKCNIWQTSTAQQHYNNIFLFEINVHWTNEDYQIIKKYILNHIHVFQFGAHFTLLFGCN